MENLWNPTAAQRLVEHYAKQGISSDLALRVYTTRLLGKEPRLVLHGGGNTSCKTTATDVLGERWEVLCVKGSGWDMAVIEPHGLPAVKLQALLKARHIRQLSDEDMVALQRANLLNPFSPNPSVEALLHAFIPHKYIDHTHSTAVLSVVDQQDSQALCTKVFGSKLGFVPYIKPGFDLALAAADVFDRDPTIEGLILDKHGIFTFGASAEQAYGRMIAYVSAAEDYIASQSKPAPQRSRRPWTALPPIAAITPILRGAVALDRGEGRFDRFVVDLRSSAVVHDFLAREDLVSLADAGVSTPDLSIRIKTGPVVLPTPDANALASWADQVRHAIAAYAARYTKYFESNNARDEVTRTMLDPRPRLALLPGIGLFGIGRTHQDAKVCADIGEMWIETIVGAQAIGQFHPISLQELFQVEYWSLEQAKLAHIKLQPLSGQVAVITGGGGAIGSACAKLFAAQGAHVLVLDADVSKAKAAAQAAGNGALGLACDVTDRNAVRTAFDTACCTFGGVDIVISNAGAAWEGGIGEIDDALLRQSFELNFFAHQTVAQNAVRLFKQQGTGGVLLFNASKQAVNPGAHLGAYGLPKAATLFLSRQYALEYGKIGVRSNAVNADRIRSGLLTEAMVASRAQARGLSQHDYMAGNLLGLEVTADHIAQAFLHQTLAERSSAAVTTVDGGNIAAALR